MKNGKKPTRRQKQAIERAGYDPADWLVCKNGPFFMEIINRKNNETSIISTGEERTN
ncbi:DUF6906 family protein [Paenibacillus sp. SEL3]